jgi:hypothetical protein
VAGSGTDASGPTVVALSLAKDSVRPVNTTVPGGADDLNPKPERVAPFTMSNGTSVETHVITVSPPAGNVESTHPLGATILVINPDPANDISSRGSSPTF